MSHLDTLTDVSMEAAEHASKQLMKLIDDKLSDKADKGAAAVMAFSNLAGICLHLLDISPNPENAHRAAANIRKIHERSHANRKGKAADDLLP